MAGERGSVSSGTPLMIILSMSILLFLPQLVESADHIVGGANSNGWLVQASNTFSDWAKGQTFKVGDILVFKYNKNAPHNVYSWIGGALTCNTPLNATRHTSGADRIKLGRGANNFVCTISGHCQAGMKFTANAS